MKFIKSLLNVRGKKKKVYIKKKKKRKAETLIKNIKMKISILSNSTRFLYDAGQ